MRARTMMMVVLAACGGGKGTGTGTAGTGQETAGGGQETAGTGQETGSGGGGQETGGGAAPQPAPAGFAEADAVSFDGGELVTWSFSAGKVTRLGSAKLGDVDAEDWSAALDGDWADRDHFFLHIPPRTVLQVTATAITPVTVPPESAFQAPRPKVDDDDGLTEGGVMERSNTGLVVTDGEVWWSECPWGFPYDGWQCEVYVSAKLWPDAKAAEVGVSMVPRQWPWPGAKAPGFRLKEIDEGRILGCSPPAGTAYKQTKLGGNEEDGEMVHTVEWVSAKPPRLLLIWGSPGLADLVPNRWELHDGCMEKPILAGESAEAGPPGVWLGDETIYQGADALGPIKGDVKFRPPT